MVQAPASSDWRSSWIARRWLAAMPFLRAAAAPAPRRALDEIGADLAMATGMVIGMDLGAAEVSFLRAAEAGVIAAGGAVEQAAFGRLLSVTMVAMMVFGMGLGMLAWESLSPRLGIEVRDARQRRRDPTSLLRRALVYFPCLRSFLAPTFREGCFSCLGDGMMIVGMMTGVAVAHHLMSGSAAPVAGLPGALWMGLAMTLGMGLGLALWNTLADTATAALVAAPQDRPRSRA